MPGGRRQPLARAISEYAKMRLAAGEDRPVSLEEAFDRVQRGTVTRRDALKMGAVLGAGLSLAGRAGAAAAAAAPDLATASSFPRAWTGPHSPHVAVIGAGLAGVTAAYQLAKVGIHVDLFEARDRVGGRCWTSRGWANRQTAEHGGEFIDSRHVHLLQLVDELGLELDDLWKGWVGGSVWLNHIDGEAISYRHLKEELDPLITRTTRDARNIGVFSGGKPSDEAYSHGTATHAARAFDAMSMREWLDTYFPGMADEPVGHYLNEVMCAWYGLDLDGLSACNWIDYFLIPAPGGDERWHVRGGNDLVPRRMARKLPDGVLHLNTPLESMRRRHDGSFDLVFTDRASVFRADFVILATPFTTLRDVDLAHAGIDHHTMSAINHLAMGNDGKVLLQYDRRFNHFDTPFGVWSGGMEHTAPDFETWESSTDEAGDSGLLTVYPGGRSGRDTFAAGVIHGECPQPLRDDTVGWIDAAVPGTAASFNGRSWVDWWTGDPWTRGSYAAFGPGQMTKYWHGVGRHHGRVHFAGEQTSTYSQGYLNGGVESGDRAAIEIMRAAGVRVPKRLSRLPYSTFG